MKKCIGHEYRRTDEVKLYANRYTWPSIYRRHVCVHCGAEDYKEEQ